VDPFFEGVESALLRLGHDRASSAVVLRRTLPIYPERSWLQAAFECARGRAPAAPLAGRDGEAASR
jgi:hypothetical protein